MPIIDLHVDLSYQYNYQGKSFESANGEFQARDLERAGVRGVVLPLYVPHDVSPVGPRLEDLEHSYARVFGAILKTPPYALPGCGHSAGKVSTWFAFEGAGQLAQRPDQLPVWVARGVRLFGLVHSRDNSLSGSSGEPGSERKGLSTAGLELARQIVALGGVLDVSHASDRATDELIELGRRAGVPVVASHSNARALAPHPRNLTDAQIRGLAATGGVVGLNLHQRFLARRGAGAEIADVLSQVRHVKRLVGIEHLALGTDYEGGIRPVPGLGSIAKLQTLAEALRADGLAEGEIEQIFYKNALRVLCPAR
ncbi:MAG TPA: membrane dipeptidase [Polyangiaceae bacterium]|nr:membrane dipeptidase [Polyangiaceae bacterium]